MRKFGWGLMMGLCVATAIYAWRFLVVSPETLFPDTYEGEGTLPYFFILLNEPWLRSALHFVFGAA